MLVIYLDFQKFDLSFQMQITEIIIPLILFHLSFPFIYQSIHSKTNSSYTILVLLFK